MLNFPSRFAGKLCPPTCTHALSPSYSIKREDKSYIYSKHKDISKALESLCSTDFNSQNSQLQSLINKCKTDNLYRYLGNCLSYLGQEVASVRQIMARILKILSKREHLLTFINGRAIKLLSTYLLNRSVWNTDFSMELSYCSPIICQLLTECHKFYQHQIPTYITEFLSDIAIRAYGIIATHSFEIQNIPSDSIPDEDPRY